MSTSKTERHLSLILAMIALMTTLCSAIWFLAKIDKDLALTAQLNESQTKRIEIIENRMEKLCGHHE